MGGGGGEVYNMPLIQQYYFIVPVHLLEGKWQCASIKNLLILNTITLEVVLETKLLNPHCNNQINHN